MAASVPPSASRWLDFSRLRGLEEQLHEPERIRRVRAAAREAFEALPLEPNPLYRGYSNFAGADLREIDFGAEGPAVPLPARAAATLRIVHDAVGTRTEVPPELSAAGVTVRTLPELWNDGGGVAEELLAPILAEDKLTALARATINRAVEVVVPDRCPLPVRVEDLTVLSSPHQGLSVRREIRAGVGSRLLYAEELYATRESEADGPRLYGSTVRISVAEEAQVHYLSVHAPDPRAVSLYQRRGSVGRSARLAWMWAGFGGFRTRLRNLSELVGTASALEDLQAFYGRGEQAYDSSVQISHIGTDTHGQSVTRGVFKDTSQGVSRGLVRIEKEARKTVSFLSEHAMLLSRGARSDTIPVLEILCRDVKATHSSSVAPVDPEKVFYLASRGFREGDAVRMIGEGFLAHVLERAPIVGLRDHLYPILAARWDGHPVVWTGDASGPSLPPLEVRAADAAEDWRFDSKLR